MDLVTIGAASAGQSPARTFARKPPYQVDPKSAEKWPGDNATSSAIKHALQKSQISDEDKQRAFSVSYWSCRFYRPLLIDLQDRRINQGLKLGEVTDEIDDALRQLDPKPDFNFDRFGDHSKSISDRDLKLILTAIQDEILIGNWVILPSLDDVGVVLDIPHYSISNSGRLLPVFRVKPLRDKFGSLSAPSSLRIVEPTTYLENTVNHATKTWELLHKAYTGEIDAGNIFNIEQNDSAIIAIFQGIYLKKLIDAGKSFAEEILSHDRFRSLEISDSFCLAEVESGQRIPAHDLIYHSPKLTFKPDSTLLKQLEKMAKKGFSFAYSACTFRPHCLNLLNDENAFYGLMERLAPLIFFSSPPPDHFDLAVIFAKAFSPYIDSSFKKINEHTEPTVIKSLWISWLKKNLRGNEQKRLAFVKTFSEAIKAAAAKILDEHFYRDLNDVIPGFVDVEVPFKGWSEELETKLR